MVYFGACDETGHRDGFHPSVPSYIKAIETVDSHVGKLLKSIESRPNYENEDWLILISSDHGGQGTGHGKGHNVPPGPSGCETRPEVATRRRGCRTEGVGVTNADLRSADLIVHALVTRIFRHPLRVPRLHSCIRFN